MTYIKIMRIIKSFTTNGKGQKLWLCK